MADQSLIAWTNSTANFWLGCFKVSPGCKHCYADTLTTNRMGLNVFGPVSTTRRQAVKSVWGNVRKWDREARQAGERRRVFVMSLGDFFEDHPDAHEVRPRAWEAMRATEWLDFQILTKRPELIEQHLPADWHAKGPWPNVWLGTSIEDDERTARADILRAIPAHVRWLSIEPLIAPVPSLDLTGIHWAIVGGESGPGYREMDHAWARAVRDKAGQGPGAAHADAPTAFFMKQSAAFRTEMGTYLIEEDGSKWAWKQYPRTPFNPAGTFAAPERVAA